MDRLQNYLDQHVVDNLALRVLWCDEGADVDADIFRLIREHEMPHFVFVEKADISAVFRDRKGAYRRAADCSKKVAQFKRLGAYDLPDVLRLKRVPWKDCKHCDVRLDPKRRCDAGEFEKGTHMCPRTEGFYYCEHRRIHGGWWIMRLFTCEKAKHIIAKKLPVYMRSSPRSLAKGNVLKYHAQRIVQTICADKDLVQTLRESQARIRLGKKKVAFDSRLFKLRLLERNGKCSRMTPRGNFACFFSKKN